MQEPVVIYVKDAPTKLVGSYIYLVDIGQQSLIAGGIPPNHRRQIAISNPHASAVILVYAQPGGPVIQQIMPRSTWTMCTNADLYIGPSTTIDTTAYVLQTFYI